MSLNVSTSFLLKPDKKLPSAEEFLRAYQKCWPKPIYKENMEFLDFMEFAEDYADFVCCYEKMFSARGKLKTFYTKVRVFLYINFKLVL